MRLRLRDGSVVTARFNRSHSLRHGALLRVAQRVGPMGSCPLSVRSFIEHLRPGEGGLGVLVSGMPPQPLAEVGGAAGRTLEELGLLGSVISHK
jgi:hypothetical protein